MKSYSPERKAAILKKLLPPLNMSVAELSRQENISHVTLYAWRKQLRKRGHVVPGSQLSPELWSAEARFAVVVETATLSEVELNEYCRKKGLFPEQVKAWKEACLNSQRPAATKSSRSPAEREETRQDKKRIRSLEKELQRKERALAEAAALLVLRKKLNAFWDERSDADD
jgi:transposase-like protein